MIGSHVDIQGNVGSYFTETNLANGNPVQMVDDFFGLNSTLDSQLTTFYNTVATNDVNGDNRLNLAVPAEGGRHDPIPSQYDKNGDGYIDSYDFFLGYYDSNGDGRLSTSELNTSGSVMGAEIMQLIDTFGDPTRTGYNDGFIDNNDHYAKIHGTVYIASDATSWNNGQLAGGNYHSVFQGTDHPRRRPAANHTSSATQLSQYSAQFHELRHVQLYHGGLATGNLATQATQQAAPCTAPPIRTRLSPWARRSSRKSRMLRAASIRLLRARPVYKEYDIYQRYDSHEGHQRPVREL